MVRDARGRSARRGAHSRSRLGAARVLPGGLRRLLRAPTRWIAVLLLGSVAIASAGIQNAAANALRETLDANWRGAYDILVTSPLATTELDGLLSPNSLGVGSQGLSLDDVERIRAVDGVDVAAPIGEMVTSSVGNGLINLSVPVDDWGGADAPQAYRLTMTFATDDGLGPRALATTSKAVIIDETPPVESPVFSDGCMFEQFTVDPLEFPLLCSGTFFDVNVWVVDGTFQGGGGGDTVENRHHIFDLGLFPEVSTRITLVDPEAERALLGDGGDFLAPLIEIGPDAQLTGDLLQGWAEEDGGEYAVNFLSNQEDLAAVQAGFADSEFQREVERLYAANGEEYVVPESPEIVQVPILIADRGPAPLDVTVTVESYGPLNPADTPFQFIGERVPESLRAGEPGELVGTTEFEGDTLLNRFAPTSQTIPWPGTESQELVNGIRYGSPFIYYTAIPDAGQYERVPGPAELPSVTLSASGYVSPFRSINQVPEPFTLSNDSEPVGTESVYTDLTRLPDPSVSSTAVPVGAFSVSVLDDLQSSLSYVPLGAYQPIGSTVTDSSEPAFIGAELLPSLTGLGLVSPETVAIASIKSAPAWMQETPVSAVRVRVADITGYTLAAQQRVLSVAEQIAALGFTATVVAGSSPTPVAVQVEDYAFGTTDPAGQQTVGPLGTIEQEWSELGAAARADSAISTATTATLAIALGAATLLLGTVQLAGVPARRADARVYRQLGWRRGRVAAWWAREEAPAVGIVALAAIAAVALSGGTPLTVTVSGAAVAVVVVLALVTIALSARSDHERGRRRLAWSERWARRRASRMRVRRVTGFGLRQPRIHPVPAAALILAIALVGVASASLLWVYLEGVREAGASLLAQFVAAQAAVPQLALALIGIASGIVLASLGRRLDLDARRAQWATLRGAGWTTRNIRLAQRAEALVTAIPAIVLGALVVIAIAVLAVEIPFEDSLLFVAAGAIASAVVATVVYLPGKRGVA